MSRKTLMISAACVGLMAAAPAMAKGDALYQLPLVSGSTETIAFGVTNNQTITGYTLNGSGVESGFVGPADGSNYVSFSDGTTGTEPRGINRNGYITGIDNTASGNVADYIPFVRSPAGTITDVTMDGTVLNYLVQGINKRGIFAGSYEDASGTIFGYTGKNARYKNGITLPGITTTAVAGRGINDRGDIVGWYADASGVQHGFLLSRGTATTIDNSGGPTNLEGINNNGEISGLYTDTSGSRHGFTYDIKSRAFTELTIPNQTFVEAWGINDKGVVALDGTNPTGLFVGYLYCPKAHDCPTGAVAVGPQRSPVLQHVPIISPNIP